MNRILLQRRDDIRKFVSFRIASNDGSIYISVVRKGESNSHSYYFMQDTNSGMEHLETLDEKIPKGIDISYHTTGRINFKNTLNPTIFGEPLVNITQNYWFASVIIPDFSFLDAHDESPTENDFVFRIQDDNIGRIQLDFCMSPFNEPITSYGFVKGHFSYPHFYTLNIIESDQQIPRITGSEEKVAFVSPRDGLHKHQQMSREEALVKYHQKRMMHAGPVIYGPNRQGVYRIIFPIAATKEPEVLAKINDPQLSIDVISVTKVEARFTVRDTEGRIIMKPIEWERVELGNYRLTIHSTGTG